jgi:dihydrofolate reductase
MITLIVARARNGAIGKANTIPWRAPEDLAFFQRETTGGAVIMGRKTWESLPFKPLKNRLNIVVSSNPDVAEVVCPDPAAAIAHAQTAGHSRIYGIGGQAIYRHMLPLAHRLLITEVGVSVEDADAYFPQFTPHDWHLIASMPLRAADPECVLTEYLRA